MPETAETFADGSLFLKKKPHISVRLLAPQGGLFSNRFWDELSACAMLDYVFNRIIGGFLLPLICILSILR